MQPWGKVCESSIYYFPNVESLLKKISTCHNNLEEDCMERFGKDLKEHVTKIVNYEQKK